MVMKGPTETVGSVKTGSNSGAGKKMACLSQKADFVQALKSQLALGQNQG